MQSKMKKLVCFIFASLLLLAYSQQAEGDDKNKKKMEDFQRKIDNKKGSNNKENSSAGAKADKVSKAAYLPDSIGKRVSVRSFPDISNYYSEYYANVVNQYGMWKGVGRPLTPEQRRHRNTYFRLARPLQSSPLSPFTHMQVLNSFGQLDNMSYGPILANPFEDDEGISVAWRDRLQSLCQFEKVYRKGVFVQENMYDADGVLVLQYHPAPVSDNQFIGHYTDAYGTLAQLRTDPDSKYVSVRLDQHGYEAEIAFVDEEGNIKRNSDEAFVQLFEYDKDGHKQSIMSADALSRPMIDKYKNCGWRYYYNREGLRDSSACIDQFGQPMRMPAKLSDTDVWKIRYTYDRWGNMLTRSFYDNEGRPDTTSLGVHRYVYAYNNHGQQTLKRAEGLQGQLVDYDEDRATWVKTFDDRGNLVFAEWRNRDSLYSTTGDCLQRSRFVKGKQVLHQDYNSTNGRDTILNFMSVSHNGCDTVWNYAEGSVMISRSDQRDRLLEEAYYTLDMQPKANPLWHKMEYSYQDAPKHSVQVERMLDADGRPVDVTKKNTWRTYNTEVTETDSVRHTKTISQYVDNHLVDKYGFEYDKDYTTANALLYYDSIGCRGRSFRADALYYRAVPKRSLQGKAVSWSGFNEFGEPSYILNGDRDYSQLYCNNVIDDYFYYDENGDTIPRQREPLWQFKSGLYKSFCIELIDSVALQHGLRTGDIIVRYGDWHYPVPSLYGRYHESLLCLETVRKATTAKTIIVMRHDAATKTSRLIELQMPEGTPRQLGFIYHMLYMTKKERARYERVVKAQRQRVHLNKTDTSEPDKEKVHFVTPYKVGGNTEKREFVKGFQENVVVVAWEPHANGRSYFFPCNSPYFDNAMTQDFDSVTLHYTVDGKHVRKHVFDSDFHYYVRLSNTSVDDATVFHDMADSVKQVFYREHPVEPVSLQPHRAAFELMRLPGSQEFTDAGERYRGDDVFRYGNVNSYHYVKLNYDSLSYDQIALADNILANVDLSRYWYLMNDNDYAYFFEEKGRFTECVWKNIDGIVFLADSADFHGKGAPVIEVADSGRSLRHPLAGRYLLLQCNNWFYGKSGPAMLNSILGSEGPWKLVLAPISETGSNSSLGPVEEVTLPEGTLRLRPQWGVIPDDLFWDALHRTKRLIRKAGSFAWPLQ